MALTTLQAVTLAEATPLMRGAVMSTLAGVTLVQNTAQDVYNRNQVDLKCALQFLRLQNVGTKAVFVAINDTATAVKYNYILAADTGAEAGNGGVLEIPGAWAVNNVSIICTDAAGSKVAITLVVTSLNVRVQNF